MYGVFIPSKTKPLKVFSCLRSASDFSDKGISRCVFDLHTRKEVTAGTISRTLENFLLEHSKFVITNKLDVELYNIEKKLSIN